MLWGVGRLAFPGQAEGSLIRRADGTVAGPGSSPSSSRGPEYFHSRPSAVDYNAAATGGSNNGPSNPDHLKAVRARLDAVVSQERVTAREVPSEMVTASGAGLDPHIPPAAAAIQARRVASRACGRRGGVLGLVRARTEPPALGFLGRARVNVLELNLALDAAFGRPAPAPGR